MRLAHFFAGLACLVSTAWAQPSVGYLSFAEGEKRLVALARQNSALLQLTSIGTSPGGRKLHMLTIASPGKVQPEARPAVFLGANIVGFHNTGSQAAVAFVEKLLSRKEEATVKRLLETRTFYIAPMLNPDAHDGLFTAPRFRRSSNAGQLDRDLDGFLNEDGFNDLNQDGKITMMRIADPNGEWLVDGKDPRLMRRADPLKGETGKFLLLTEGDDDDKDGQFNEDGPGGYRPDRNFAHGWNDSDPESGPWPSAQPEAKAVMDFLIAHRNVAMAIVFGPANNLLDLPRGAGARLTDVGSLRVRIPGNIARNTGLDATKEYTIDEVYELLKDSPMARAQGGLTKESLAQFLGGGPAVSPDAEDLKFYQSFADEYKKLLEKSGLDNKRSGGQSAAGGLQNWLYYQYSTFAIELDVWGIPKKSANRPAAAASNGLTIESFEKMSSAEVAAIEDDKLAAFLKSVNAPPMATPAMIKQGAASGRMTPAQMVSMIRGQGGAGRGASSNTPATAGLSSNSPDEDTIAYIDTVAKDGFTPWTPVTLADGRKAEVGGVDPFLSVTPLEADLKKATDAHAEAILMLAGKLAEVAISDVQVKSLGSGIFEVKATAINQGFLATATRLQVRTRSFLPARLTLSLPSGAKLVQGNNRVSSERMTGSGGTINATWLVSANTGDKLTIRILTPNAGEDRREVVIP